MLQNQAFTIIESSQIKTTAARLFIAVSGAGQKFLGIEGDPSGFDPVQEQNGIHFCPLTARNAAAIRQHLPWLNPVPLGLRPSFGFGDRLGLATPGHLSAVKSTRFFPIFAQQSVRENERTGRTPQEVLDDVVWALFESGWQGTWGADADHLKHLTALTAFLEAGYTFFTIDPSDHVDNAAQADTLPVLKEKIRLLKWEQLGTTWQNWEQVYLSRPIQLDLLTLNFDEEKLLRAACKYAKALLHVKQFALVLDDHFINETYDLEMSVDETDTPTSIFEHYFLANEAKRLGIHLTSLAPRFIGRFEKGVDYIGDLSEFEHEFAQHAQIMQHFGSYKLSIHTGSDKFSLYPLIARYAGEWVHVKTAGTSYLEALRVAAAVNPHWFREIFNFCIAHYEDDKRTYHVSAELAKVPAINTWEDARLPELFEQFDARQVMHVTFGSVLDAFGVQFKHFLKEYQTEYEQGLQKHFARHLDSFLNA